jgi:hypothetical protein
MLSVTYAECHYPERRYAKCRYAECHYAECRFADCRGALNCARPCLITNNSHPTEIL